MTTPGCDWRPGTRTAKIIDHKPINGSPPQLRALHDTTKNSMSTLKNIDVSTKSWDPIQCFIIRRKLDQQSLAPLQNSADAPTEIPTLRSVLTFTERRACILETISAQPTATLRHQSVHNEESCKICHLGPHHLRACSRFQEMDPKTQRLNHRYHSRDAVVSLVSTSVRHKQTFFLWRIFYSLFGECMYTSRT